MAQLSLGVRASTPQESSDIVILAGHSRLQYQALGESITRTFFLRVSQQNPRLGLLGLPSFDLPTLRA
jgi:hypothetical protein